MLINLVVGDWSYDGHGKTSTLTYEVTGTDNPDDVKAAFYEGQKILGITPGPQEALYGQPRTFCHEYEDNAFPATILKTLGIEYYEEEVDENGMAYVEPEAYAEFYVRTVMLGNPTLVLLKLVNTPVINIGGYGLFY